MKARFVLFLGLCIITNILFAQGFASFNTSNTPTTLNYNTVTCISQDASGNHWFSGGGLAKYDGVNWVRYPRFDVSVITPDAQGNIWFGGYLQSFSQGLWFFDGSNLTLYANIPSQQINDINVINAPISFNISAIAIDGQGNKWIGTDQGIAKFDGTSWITYTSVNDGIASDQINDIYIDDNNYVWIATPNGMSKFDGSTWITYNPISMYLSNPPYSQINLTDISKISKSLLLSGVYYSQGSNFNNGSGGRINNNNSLVGSDVERDLQSNGWFATNIGVYKLTGSNWTAYTVANTSGGLASDYSYEIFVDAQDNKWIGTNAGASKFDGSTWTKYPYSSGIKNNVIKTVFVDDQNYKWFGTRGGASKFNDTLWFNENVTSTASNPINHLYWSIYSKSGGLKSDTIYSINKDMAGNIWFSYGIAGFGVTKYNGSIYSTYTTTNGLINNYVNSIAVDNSGNLWFGTNGGVSKFDGVVWTNYTTSNGLVNDNVNVIKIDDYGNKWIGTNGGISKFDGTNWTTYTTSNGLTNNNVRDIAFDANGNKWFATNGGGVSKFDGSIWTSFTTSNGLASNQVFALAIDNQDTKWFGTLLGVSQFDNTTWTTYTTTDGLANNNVNAVSIDENGRKWFGTNDGVSLLIMPCDGLMPANAGTISGPSIVCQGQNNVVYSVPLINNADTYIWTLPIGSTGSSTTNSISVSYGTTATSGNITVKGTNTCGDGAISTLTLTVNSKPTTPTISIAGNVLLSDATTGNQWYDQNGLINGATNQYYVAISNGSYYVIVANNGCDSDPSNVINVVLTGIENIDENRNLIIYPNPVSNELIIEINDNNEKVNFDILNEIGQVVYKGNLIEKTTVQTSDFAPGVYLIKLENGNTFKFEKIIKE